MHKKIYFQKLLILGTVLSICIFGFACQENANKNDEELLKNDGQTLTQLNNIGTSLKANRLTAEEFEELKKIREKYPTALQVRQTYLNALFIRQDWRAVAELLTENSSKKMPQEENLMLAKAYFKLGEYQKAINILESFSEKDFDTKNILGQIYFQNGQTEKAITVLEEVKDQNIAKKNVDGLSILGLTYLRQNDLPKAIEVLRKAVELDANHIPTTNALSLAYSRQGKKELAEVYRQKTVELQKNNTDKTFESSQRVQKVYEIEQTWNAKNYEEVIKIANEMLLLTTNKDEKIALYQYLFQSYSAIGKNREAENAATEGKKLQQQ